MLSNKVRLIILGAAIAIISSVIIIFVRDWLRRRIEREEYGYSAWLGIEREQADTADDDLPGPGGTDNLP